MRVLIINPPWPGKGYGTRSQNRIIKQRSDKFLQYPIYLAYAAAQLKRAGYEVHYIDSVIQELDMAQTLEKIKQIKPDVIFMETTTPSIEADFAFISSAKKISGAVMIAAGPHVTHFPVRSLEECEGLDIVIRREFDTKITGIIGNLGKLDDIKGIAFKKEGKIVDNGPGEDCLDLDSLPFPDRDLVPHHWYLEAWYSRRPFINIMTSRGCPYPCTFCLWPQAMYGHRQRFRSIDNVISELKFVIEKYGVKEVNVDDGTFTTNRSRVLEFCEKLQRNGIKLTWTCNGRVDNVDEEMLREMKRAGCKMIRYGVESGSAEVLKKIRKGITFEQIEKAFHLTKKAGIQALGGFMFGYPHDSRKTVEETIQYAIKLSPDQVQFSICMAYPGTAIYADAEKEGKLDFRSWKEFDMTYGPVVKTRDMERSELKGILAQAYRRFYFRPRYFLQTLRKIRDRHELTRVARSMASLVKTILLHSRKV
jgi:anaerobic magnesium-protoporphyrin IX monomethyl ester cyclase